MKIAVVGCSHGALDEIYSTMRKHEGSTADKVDLLLCCGDFEANRNKADLVTMEAPSRYRALVDFHNYYAGRRVAPVLTIVVGGNHEAMGYMRELYHGGWLAPNIYYLGAAGCVLVDGWLRIAGSSGIYDARDFRKGHHEIVPFKDREVYSSFHVRQYDFFRLWQLRNVGPKIDILMSHDWPQHIEEYGDKAALLLKKPTFAPQITRGNFGSTPLEALVGQLKPTTHVAGHHHVRFEALRVHSAEEGDATRFLGLSKPGGPRGEAFLEVIDVPTPPTHASSTAAAPVLYFDPNWLTIVRALSPSFPSTSSPTCLPPKYTVSDLIQEAKAWVAANVVGDTGLKGVDAVQQFGKTAPATMDKVGNRTEGSYASPRSRTDEAKVPPPARYTNPQTTAFCAMLGIEDLSS